MNVPRQVRLQRRVVDGVLLLDKPIGLSSNAALQAARRLLNALKAGHTGTLDPMATGLLPLTFGEATKFSQMLLDADKTYEATVRLGIETDSGDAEGAIIAESSAAVSTEAVACAIARFTGEIEQIPPMYSALKRDSRPLYEYARAGIELERAPRRVFIHSLEVLEFAGDSFRIRVDCSKGTYIRTLAIDLGRVLGCGAHLSALRRTRIGAFDVADAVSLEALDALPAERRDAALAPPDALVAHFPRVALDPAQSQALLQGRNLSMPVAGLAGFVRVYGGGRFLGLAEWDTDGKLLPRRLISTATTAQQQG